MNTVLAFSSSSFHATANELSKTSDPAYDSFVVKSRSLCRQRAHATVDMVICFDLRRTRFKL